MRTNSNSRTKNAVLAVGSGLGGNVLSLLFTLVYRVVFLRVLTREYLGISGVFTNILSILSIAELGIGQSITYRLYKPFQSGDAHSSAALLQLFKRAHRIIFAVIMALGTAMLPFLKYLIDFDEIPGDVSIYAVYMLFVFESASAYLFTYKKCLLNVNQEMYISNLLDTGVAFLSTVLKIVLLLTTGRFEAVLVTGITVSLVSNVLICRRITRANADVFKLQDRLSCEETRQILHDTMPLSLAKVGGTVLSSTDNILMSVFVSLSAVGMYANYSTIVDGVKTVVFKFFNSYQPTIANFIANNPKNETGRLYGRLLFANMWLSSVTSICLYALINPFITIWLDASYTLDRLTVAVICIQYFIVSSRALNMAYIDASGLFVRDKWRPCIEAAINLLTSVILVRRIGMAGVFLGTCISELTTCYWREYYILYRDGVIADIRRFVLQIAGWIMSTVVLAVPAERVWTYIEPSWTSWVVMACALFAGINLLYALILRKTDGYRYMKGMIEKIRRHR